VANTKKRRGLAAMSPERRRQIAAKGAKALHKAKKAHRFTEAEAKLAAAVRWAETAPLGTCLTPDVCKGDCIGHGDF
jgi:hypothetical protein